MIEKKKSLSANKKQLVVAAVADKLDYIANRTQNFPMKIDWDKLRIFSEVAQVGSFSQASQVLCVSQSAISRQVGILEKELGCLLFNRLPRGLELTNEGELLNKTLREVVSRLASAEMRLIENKYSPRGTLKIVVNHFVGVFWLPRYLEKFSVLYPHISFQTILTEKEVDFSVSKADISLTIFHSADGEILCSHPLPFSTGIFASTAYLKERGYPENLEDLDRHVLLSSQEKFCEEDSSVDWLQQVGCGKNFSRQAAFSFSTLVGLYAAVKNGAGIGHLPHFMVHHEEQVVELFTAYKKPMVFFYIACPKQALSLKRVFVFREFLLENISSPSL